MYRALNFPTPWTWTERQTYPDHCQYCRCNSFPIESSNRVRPSLRCKHIYIRHRPECIDHDVNIHFRIQLCVWVDSVGRRRCTSGIKRKWIRFIVCNYVGGYKWRQNKIFNELRTKLHAWRKRTGSMWGGGNEWCALFFLMRTHNFHWMRVCGKHSISHCLI